ncbi:hypothetical protein Bca101_067160 [Brassica carinata]
MVLIPLPNSGSPPIKELQPLMVAEERGHHLAVVVVRVGLCNRHLHHPVKFSDYTERLQFIYSLRKGTRFFYKTADFLWIAKVEKIGIFYVWCYIACAKCPSKLQPELISFTCGACHNENDDGVIRYRVQLLVPDVSENSECLFSLL